MASNYLIRNNMNEIEFENGSLDDLLDGTPSNEVVDDDSTPQDDNIPASNPEWLDDTQGNPDDNSDNDTIADSDVLTSFLSQYGWFVINPSCCAKLRRISPQRKLASAVSVRCCTVEAIHRLANPCLCLPRLINPVI